MLVLLVPLVAALAGVARAHDPSAPPPIWNREISRIVYARCASCHRPGGSSFSLMTYPEAQKAAVAIKAAVLSRRMPPWGAVKGFGDFRNDTGLTQEQISLITDWVEGDTPRGNNPNALPPTPKFTDAPPFTPPANGVKVRGQVRLDKPILLDGILPRHVPANASMPIVANMPDGRVAPLVWLYQYENADSHPFLFRRPLDLPAGAVIQGVSPDAEILLLPVVKR